MSLKRVFFSIGRAGKGNNGCNPPFFGYYWGYWLPYFSWNKGNPFKNQVLDVSVSWLIFWFGISVWPKAVKREEAQTSVQQQPLMVTKGTEVKKRVSQ